jgi:probable blue pigment (indigoidine) exporter
MSFIEASRHRPEVTAVLFVVLGLFWGTSFVSIEVGLEFFPPILFAAGRYYLAGVLMLGYAVYSTDRWFPRTTTSWVAVGVAGVFIIAGYHALLYLGTQYVSGALAAVVISLSPVLTAVFAGLLLTDEHVGPVGAVGFLCGLVGVTVVVSPDPSDVLSANLFGVGLVFLGGASFALGSVLSRPLRTDLPVQSLQAWTMLFGAVVLHAGSALRGESVAAVEWTVQGLLSFGYLAVVSGALAFLLYFELLDRVGPTELNLIGYLEPVVATLVSWLVLGEFIDSATVVGFVAILAGFALLERQRLRDVAITHW